MGQLAALGRHGGRGRLLAFVLGWVGNLQWSGAGRNAWRRARPLSEFARQAVLAHVVYSPEVRHPVEVRAAQQEHLVQWLSKRLGRVR